MKPRDAELEAYGESAGLVYLGGFVAGEDLVVGDPGFEGMRWDNFERPVDLRVRALAGLWLVFIRLDVEDPEGLSVAKIFVFHESAIGPGLPDMELAPVIGVVPRNSELLGISSALSAEPELLRLRLEAAENCGVVGQSACLCRTTALEDRCSVSALSVGEQVVAIAISLVTG